MPVQNCKNCQTDFTIQPADTAFYSTINVPAPTWCPQCRFQRRLMFRNERNLYARQCGMCNANILSNYSPEAPYVIYCRQCWWSDKWDPLSYGKAVDFSRPFFEQFNELRLQVPRIALLNDSDSENSEYTNHVYRMKNCYMVFDAIDDEGCIHSTGLYNCKDDVDCAYNDNTELCYETLYAEQCYGLRNSRDTINCRDSAFLSDCIGVSNSLMCVGLRNKEYCYKNQQLTESEFKQVWKEAKLHTRTGVQKLKAEFDDFSKTIPRKFYHGVNNEDASGDYLLNNKSVTHSFQTRNSENSAYCYGVHHAKDSYDYTVWGEAEQFYEAHASGDGYRLLFCNIVWGGKETYYSDNCLNSPDNCFGCVAIKKQQYCILNKQYTEEEYFKLRDKLIEHMKTTGEWGEFFPPALAPFAYNETMANEFFPLTKEQALQKGYTWQDNLPGTFGKETIRITDLADSITDCTDEILKEVLACTDCKRNYKIVKAELDFYKQQQIPIPDRCPDCRHLARTHYRSGYELVERGCMCKLGTHDHGTQQCSQKFNTAYPQTNPAILYCEDCYRKETY